MQDAVSEWFMWFQVGDELTGNQLPQMRMGCKLQLHPELVDLRTQWCIRLEFEIISDAVTGL